MFMQAARWSVVGTLFVMQSALALPTVENPYLEGNGYYRTNPFPDSGDVMGDNEGSAYVPADDSLWLVDDYKGRLYEVSVASGALRQLVARAALEAVKQYGGTTPAGLKRTTDLEALAYDPAADVLYAFNGKCCTNSPSTPTVFRFTRQSGQLTAESWQNLPAGSDFSGAAFNAVTGEIWVGQDKTLYPYSYENNRVGAGFTLDIRGNISGLDFTSDGNDLLMVTSSELLYRVAWPGSSLVPGYGISVPGLQDTRSVVVIGETLLIANGYDAYPAGEPLKYAVHRFGLRGGHPPDSVVFSPLDKATVPSPVTVSGTAMDDRAVASIRLQVRDRATGQYLQANGTWGKSYWFEVSPDSSGSSSTSFGWTSPRLAAGAYYLVARAVDDTGLWQTTSPRTYFYIR